MTEKSVQKKNKFPAYFPLAGLIIVVLIGILLLRTQALETLRDYLKPQPTVFIPPTPTPAPIPQGKQRYSVRSDEKLPGPKIFEAVVDPFDPKIGENQMMSVSINHKKPVTSVLVTLFTDNGTKSYTLTQKSIKDNISQWEGSWTASDKHSYTYKAEIKATDATSSSEIVLSFRP